MPNETMLILRRDCFAARFSRIRNLILTTTLITVAGIISTANAGSDDLLTLSINSGKSVYRAGEPIVFSIVLANKSGRPVTVNRRMEFPRPELSLQIRDASGKLSQWLPPIPPPPLTKDDFKVMPTDEELTTIVTDIGRYLSVPPVPDVYTVTAIYRNAAGGDEFGVNAWTGKLISNTSRFEVLR